MRPVIVKVLAVSLCITLATCKKKDDPEKVAEEAVPVASFTTNKAEYISGETIQLINTSTNASSYRWTLPDGQTSTAKETSFVITHQPVEQSFTFKLEAFSESKNKSDYMVKIIKAKPAEGRIYFYSSKSGNATVSVDGKAVFSSAWFPDGSGGDCGDSGTVVVPAGTHVVTYQFEWNFPTTKTIEVAPNGCVRVSIF